MNLDVATVIFTCLLLGALVSVLSVVTSFLETAAPWLRLWGAANVCLMIGTALILGQGSLHPALSVVLANLCLIMTYYLIEAGLRKFFGLPLTWLWPVILMVVTTAFFSFFVWALPSVPVRTVAYTILTVVSIGRIIGILGWQGPPGRGSRRIQRLLLAFFILLGLVYLARLGLAVQEGIVSIRTATTSSPLIFLIVTFGVITWTMGFHTLHHLRVRSALESANATRAKILAIISHDVRGPMGNLAVVLKDLVESGTCQDPGDDLLKLTASTAADAQQLLENLLDWAKDQRGEIRYQAADLNADAIVLSACRTLEPTAQAKNIRLTEGQAIDLIVRADRNTLETVLRNLISNAIKFTPPGGAVSWEIAREPNWGLIRIRDTGPGLPAQVIQDLAAGKIPETTWGTNGEKGSGLGLSLCQSLVQGNHGQLEFQSNASGTVVTVRLPLSSA